MPVRFFFFKKADMSILFIGKNDILFKKKNQRKNLMSMLRMP